MAARVRPRWPAGSGLAWPTCSTAPDPPTGFDQTAVQLRSRLAAGVPGQHSQEANTGRASGASVIITRSGTNQLHGDLFWFGRNARFNAIKADATRMTG